MFYNGKPLKVKNFSLYKILPKIKNEALLPGDILIRKNFENNLDIGSKIVVKAQRAANLFRQKEILSSEYNGHAALVISASDEKNKAKIAESVPNYAGGDDGIGGVCLTTLSQLLEKALSPKPKLNETYACLFIVFRCRDSQVSKMATDIAKICIGDDKNRYGWYNNLSAVKSVLKQTLGRGFRFLSSEPRKFEEFYNFICSRINETQSSKKSRVPNMICSEFVTYIYELAVHYLNSQHRNDESYSQYSFNYGNDEGYLNISPMILQHLLNVNPNYRLIGTYDNQDISFAIKIALKHYDDGSHKFLRIKSEESKEAVSLLKSVTDDTSTYSDSELIMLVSFLLQKNPNRYYYTTHSNAIRKVSPPNWVSLIALWQKTHKDLKVNKMTPLKQNSTFYKNLLNCVILTDFFDK